VPFLLRGLAWSSRDPSSDTVRFREDYIRVSREVDIPAPPAWKVMTISWSSGFNLGRVSTASLIWYCHFEKMMRLVREDLCILGPGSLPWYPP